MMTEITQAEKSMEVNGTIQSANFSWWLSKNVILIAF
jgi:hypothetical protein